MGVRLEPGVVRIGHTRSGESGADEVVVAEFDDRGVLVSWPRALGFMDAMSLNDGRREVPDPLVLRDAAGWLTLTDGWSSGVSASTLAHSLDRIRYDRSIEAGAKGVDYASVNGMQSEVDGLAKWSRRTPVTTNVMYDDERKRFDRLQLEAKNLDPLPLGGPLGLELNTSFRHAPHPKNGVYTISTGLTVYTRSRDLVDWGTHALTHGMIQDLMCLVYGRPCAARLTAVMREDDQDTVPKDHRRWWKPAYQPTFGRGSGQAIELPEEARPLFYYDDADPARISAWLEGYEYWSRPTWIAVSTLFHPTLPVESRLLQVGVALEALGFAILSKSRGTLSRTPSYETLLKAVMDPLIDVVGAVIGEATKASAWRRDFYAAFKGAKHADNPLPEGRDAEQKAREGFTLIRCWLAAALGVSSGHVAENLRLHA